MKIIYASTFLILPKWIILRFRLLEDIVNEKNRTNIPICYKIYGKRRSAQDWSNGVVWVKNTGIKSESSLLTPIAVSGIEVDVMWALQVKLGCLKLYQNRL